MRTVAQAAKILGGGRARVTAGGTDLLGALKDDVLPEYPELVVNLKTVPGLDYIREEDGILKIGALTRLSDIAGNLTIQEKYTALAQAAHAVASPHIRDMGTLGGNLSQFPRCWYFRKPDNRFNCNRKGGDECFALTGDNRFHSIFGGKKAHLTPCTRECPAGTDIPGYFALLRAGDWDAAARRIMEMNPMPAVTARVCAHFCHSACNRCQSDEGVFIGGVERALGDYILDNSDKFYLPPARETGKSAAVVGSGPAGLSAAYFLRLAGHAVTVFDGKEDAGGMLRYAIPAYRLPKDIVRRVAAALTGMGVVFRQNTRVGADIAPERLEMEYDGVCYATGAWKRPVVGIAGEELTTFGLDFLVEVNQWMDGKVGADVLVTGGGNVAVDVAVTAKRLGAKSVTLACLEPRGRMPASAEEIARAEAEGIVIMPSWGLSRVVEEDGAARGMELKRCVSPWDDNGAFNPQYDVNEKIVVRVENILMAVGQRVDLSFLSEKYLLELNRRGLIGVAENSGAASRAGVFAAGDVTTGPATVVGGIANGRRAARGMNIYFSADAEPGNSSIGERLTFDAEGIQNKAALKLRESDAGKRRVDLEDSETPARDEAAREASRCLNCGCYAVNPSDTAPALAALGAHIVTNKRVLGIEELFEVRTPGNTCLDADEIIMEIQIPAPLPGTRSAFMKFAFRKSIDFSVVSCAVSVGGKPRVCLGAVAPIPYRAVGAETALAGKEITEETAAAAGEAAVEGAVPFEAARYKIQIAKTLVKRALLAAGK
ncbi:MAG: FAD binding domain-containing protein [Peptococcaceae bacterium]|nr:FAD binding domain-containing protein [Peptococcaceae bacterium]